MTGNTRLTDIQLVLLATAASRDNGSLLPPPETLGEGPARIRKAVQALIRRGLAIETDLAAGADFWRTEGDRAVGVVITDAGRAAIAIDAEEPGLAIGADAPAEPVAASTEPVPALASEALVPAPTKTAAVLDLMRRDTGATLDELIEATGWLPHTTRAALTGLRKKGHAIVRGKRNDVTCYTLEAEAVA
jgi:hypothetical protein